MYYEKTVGCQGCLVVRNSFIRLQKQIGAQKIEKLKGISVSATALKLRTVRTHHPVVGAHLQTEQPPVVYYMPFCPTAFLHGLSVGCYPHNYYVHVNFCAGHYPIICLPGGTPAHK